MSDNPPKPDTPVTRAIYNYLSRERISRAELSRRVGENESLVKSILNGTSKNPRGDTLAKLANAMGITVAELTGETKRTPSPANTNAVILPGTPAPTLRDLPVYGSAEGGDGVMILDNEPIEFKDRPANLAGVRGAFSVYIVNDSMAPAFEAGDQANIHPGKPVRPGKDALFISKDANGNEHVLLKRLVKVTDKAWKVQQHNPPKTFDLPRNVWQRALRVVGCDKAD